MHKINWSNLINSGKYATITVWSVLISTIIIIILEGVLGAMTLKDHCYHNDELDNENEKNITPLPLYLFIFITSELFLIYVTYDALYHNNNIEIIGSASYNLLNSFYSLIQAYQLYKYFTESCFNRIKIYTYIIPSICFIYATIHIYLAYKLCLEFGWSIYKSIGADPKLRKIFRIYEIFITLVKYDFFFFVSYSLQLIFLILKNDDPEKYITIGLILLSLIVLYLSIKYIKEEQKNLTKFILLCFILEVCYFIFKLIRMNTTKKVDYVGSMIYMSFFSIICLGLGILTITNILMCYLNYGQGLKEHIKLNNSTRKLNEKNDGIIGSDKYGNAKYNVRHSYKSDSTRASIRYDIINIDDCILNQELQPSIESNSRNSRKKESINNENRINDDSKYFLNPNLLMNTFPIENYSNNTTQKKCIVDDIDVTEKMLDILKYSNEKVNECNESQVSSENNSLKNLNNLIKIFNDNYFNNNCDNDKNNSNNLMELFDNNNLNN
ncbi:hypothetical protein BCR36DRAFT_341197 [Piromyces finnis]|uniref:TRP C-terminal domain-containing protein n=1 Tax=Piromyces finnis TaxID=1754191 RepID=A0A1Y1VQ72_9FUNG|nr:hypothetical protein BCR36DRAFT_341197 [Piromyces finnis]|eukprot:ORX61031.1 hypothetical protein BCR36DRAFT_341197 [Piromyces finnis]